MSTSEIIRSVRRDFVRKQRLYHRAAPLLGSFAFDAGLEEMSAKEFAEKCLRRLGLISPDESLPEDPIAALESYFAGREQAADRARGSMDALPRDHLWTDT